MSGQVIDTPEGPLLQTTIGGKNKCYGYDNPASVLKKVREFHACAMPKENIS